jgi:hypothetical protein
MFGAICCPEGKGSVPEGRSDRSQARSAWNSLTPKEPSRRARYDQALTLSQRYFASKGAPCFLRKANHSNHRIGAHTGANQTVPHGTALLRGTSCLAGPSLRDWGQSPFGLRGNKSSLGFCFIARGPEGASADQELRNRRPGMPMPLQGSPH